MRTNFAISLSKYEVNRKILDVVERDYGKALTTECNNWGKMYYFNSIVQICPNLELLTPEEKFLYIMSTEGRIAEMTANFIADNLP